jgi:hypothetical protein
VPLQFCRPRFSVDIDDEGILTNKLTGAALDIERDW